jgi:hypothetical protein
MALGSHKQLGLSKTTGYSYEGQPITLRKMSGKPIKEERHRRDWWPEEKRIEAATLYAVTRNYNQVAELSGVPITRIKAWSKEAWWDNVVSTVVKDKNEELDGCLTEIIHECQNQIKDRLKRGDVRVNFKTGEQYLVPLDVRALTMSLAILFDKRQLIRGEATSRTESISADKRLEHLKTEFEKFSKAKVIEHEKIEGEESPPLLECTGFTDLPEGYCQTEPDGDIITAVEPEEVNSLPSCQTEFDSLSPLQAVGSPDELTREHLAEPPRSPPCSGITEDLDSSPTYETDV